MPATASQTETAAAATIIPETNQTPEAPESPKTPKSRAATNRKNAQSSTGPRTPAGKAASSKNALKFGLFSTKNCVLPQDQDEYDELAAYLWNSLAPVGAIEELHATEVIRCAWRLRRCTEAESLLPKWNRQREKQRQPDLPADRNLHEPVLYNYTADLQVSIDRSRTQAQSCLRRALADLTALQTERQVRATLLRNPAERESLGLARVREVFAAAESAGNIAARSRVAAIVREQQLADAAMAEMARKAEQLIHSRPGSKTEPPARQTPRNAPCPCGSGQKHKRCCGQKRPTRPHNGRLNRPPRIRIIDPLTSIKQLF